MVNAVEVSAAVKKAIDSDDLIVRGFNAGELSCAVIYIEGLSDKQLLEQDIIAPLIKAEHIIPTEECISNTIFYCERLKIIDNLDKQITTVTDGDILLAIDGADGVYKISLKKFSFRSVTEPPTETVLRGPREGFNEEIKTNITMIRRKLKSPALKVKNFTVGRYSNTSVSVLYMDGIADENTAAEISKRIASIDIDGIIGTAYVESLIGDNKRSFFNQSGATEKPDIVAAKLLEGRIAVVVDGSPVVITYPYLMFESFQDSYDYYIKSGRSAMLRILRIMGGLVAVLLPGMYVAMQEYHYHLLPLKFLITVLNSVSGIPFTPPMEMLFVLLLFEVLYQASVRMPRYVGTALSIVGAIVLGDTAVNAGLLSSPTVLIIAISAIGINCIPDFVDTFSILRLTMLLVGSVLGLFGIVLFSVGLLAYLAGMQVFGTPYLSPFAPMIASDMKDCILKDDLRDMEKRPYSISTNNRRRQK